MKPHARSTAQVAPPFETSKSATFAAKSRAALSASD